MIKKVLSSKLGVGNSYFRTGIKEIKEVDTVPFGCYKRNIFGKIGLYNTRLTRNQDIQLNKRLKNNNGKIILIPDCLGNILPGRIFHILVKIISATDFGMF